MENFQGDLTDIIRTKGGSTIGGGNSSSSTEEWQFPSNYSSDPSSEYFGDPFTDMTDPFLHATNTPALEFSFLHNSNIVKADIILEDSSTGTNGGFAGGGGGENNNYDVGIGDLRDTKRPPNMFSRTLPVLPRASTSPRVLKGPPDPNTLAANNDLNNNKNKSSISPNSSSKLGCGLMDTPAALHISSPRNTGIKRRKSQAKKVICIPAPAPANSRPTGEIVPSDLWAWRKYGQKPIKGSPYPRGYYRCSSSKGCSARKQVERSRTDPNMLVITYTSEHNHPWPTQRNALAGSTRSQTSKNCTTSKNSPNSQAQKSAKGLYEEDMIKKITSSELSPVEENPPVAVKEEMDEDFDNHHLEVLKDADFDEPSIPQSYKPTMPDSEDSFFVDLGEIERDPLNLLFTEAGFCSDNKSLDPYTFYDWAAGSSTANTSTSTYSTETKRDS